MYNQIQDTKNIAGKVLQTIADQNQTMISQEVSVYRVVAIEWEQLITNLDNISNAASSTHDVRIGKKTSIYFVFLIYRLFFIRKSNLMHIL